MTDLPLALTRRTLLGALLGLAIPGPVLARGVERRAAQPVVPQRLALSAAVGQLGDGLLDALAFGDPAGNRLLSPWSALAATALAGLGAQGDTARDAARKLDIARGPDALVRALREARLALAAAAAGTELRILHAAWTGRDRAARQAWQTRARAALRAVPRQLDFASPRAAAEINAWVAQATRGRIPRIVDDLGADTAFVLASAVYFAGRWLHPFDPGQTRPAPFHAASGVAAEVPMMSGEFSLPYGRRGLGHMVRIPYAGKGLALTVATAQRREDGAAFLAEIRAAGATAWMAGVPLETTQLQLRLPRFSFASGSDLLQPLGNTALAPWVAPGADLRGVLGQRIGVGAVLQQARIAVDEAGTVAAAATAAIGVRGLVTGGSEFSADRPFIFSLGPIVPSLPLFVGYLGDASHARA